MALTINIKPLKENNERGSILQHKLQAMKRNKMIQRRRGNFIEMIYEIDDLKCCFNDQSCFYAAEPYLILSRHNKTRTFCSFLISEGNNTPKIVRKILKIKLKSQ